jgi:hypothetical protein
LKNDLPQPSLPLKSTEPAFFIALRGPDVIKKLRIQGLLSIDNRLKQGEDVRLISSPDL